MDNNGVGAPEGNTNAMKYKTPEERRALCEKFCSYLKAGKPKNYFPDCDFDTIQRYMKDFPIDFPTEQIEAAEREGKQKLIEVGYAGMLGKVPGFREKTWQFIVQNMTDWRLRKDVTTDGEKIEQTVIYRPEKLPEGSA